MAQATETAATLYRQLAALAWAARDARRAGDDEDSQRYLREARALRHAHPGLDPFDGR